MFFFKYSTLSVYSDQQTDKTGFPFSPTLNLGSDWPASSVRRGSTLFGKTIVLAAKSWSNERRELSLPLARKSTSYTTSAAFACSSSCFWGCFFALSADVFLPPPLILFVLQLSVVLQRQPFVVLRWQPFVVLRWQPFVVHRWQPLVVLRWQPFVVHRQPVVVLWQPFVVLQQQCCQMVVTQTC